MPKKSEENVAVEATEEAPQATESAEVDRKSTRLNSSQTCALPIYFR